MIREATAKPTKCRELVMGPPDYMGIKDASIHGVGGFIMGQKKACLPTVFRMEWPEWVKQEVLKTNAGTQGTLTNSDLEMAGLLLLWLVMEEVCQLSSGSHVALFSDNSPTVSWVNRLASQNSQVADQLIRALSLRLKLKGVSPLSTMHIVGKKNEMTDIPPCSSGSERKWFCRAEKEETDLFNLYNSHFCLPDQNLWTIFRPSQDIISRMVLEMDQWQ